ncbi:hypothetical protein MAPG_03531 [Magnaporthiopsis poae ATCC 64411]|uniref:Uncharacterized protein n=1 Tax=Magnaporthiopsis poae (strain ATCC 64411 / 73-15) TaxID=644358 RepID=A0A0C4DU94_MAGP6|nr:hypothetical protein MAPG_03531 [Magnaporthiopsis poae ATCC 64411]
MPLDFKAGDFASGILTSTLKHESRIARPLSDRAESLFSRTTRRRAAHRDRAMPSPGSCVASLRAPKYSSKGVTMDLRWCGRSATPWLPNKHSGGRDITKYSTLRYLAGHAPELPAVPKPHGLLMFGTEHISLTAYFPSTNLRDAWPSLTRKNKLSIKRQLNEIVAAWRALPISPGTRFGGAGGEGAKNLHGRAGGQNTQPMTTAEQFTDWKFSYDHPRSNSWREFVRSPVPPARPDWNTPILLLAPSP